MTITIAPLDDVSKRRLMQAVAARGQAAGLLGASKLVAMMADHKRRVVGTAEIKDLAAALAAKAAEIKAEADAQIAALEAQSKL